MLGNIQLYTNNSPLIF